MKDFLYFMMSKKRTGLCVFFSLFFLTGCESLEKISNDLGVTDNTSGYPRVSNTVLQTCATGALAGIGKTLYEDVFKKKRRRTKDYIEDAAVGTAIGCTAGAVLNHKRSQFAKKSDYYKAEIATTQSLNSELKTVNSHLFSRTAENKAQLNLLQEQKKAATLDAAAARAAKNTAKADLAWAKTQLKNAKASLSTQKTVLLESGNDLSGSSRGNLQNEVSQLEEYVRTLEQEVGYMSNINDSLVKV